MNVFECFPSRWIKSADLGGNEHDLVIDRVDLERLDERTVKPVVFFVGHHKGLMLNRTNAGTIADLYSPDTDEWHGKTITIFPTTTDYRGVSVDCIRVRRTPPTQPLESRIVEQPESSRLVLPVGNGNGSSAGF